jgi:hypothetical protein
MKFSKPERTDLVINMTLAEIFLLLLFVAWYGTTDHTVKPFAELQEKLARFEKENDTLRTQLDFAKKEISDLKWRLDWWQHTFPAVVEGSPGGSARKMAGRSFGKCQDDNVLVEAQVLNGKISIFMVTECQELTSFLVKSHRPRPKLGNKMTEAKLIKGFLEGVRDYYSNVAQTGTGCRFDYALTFQTPEDYYIGREYFEKYFYAAGLNRIRPHS